MNKRKKIEPLTTCFAFVWTFYTHVIAFTLF